ncbi:MAG: ribosome biogenesis GTPase Der [Deltaproteobacteria bacterium]|nr:ribosome biogenesis GTPase Der [Deltaproteobacteria bacterium]
MQKPLVAIVGRPNVGKSTLFNRLVGKRQALVQDRPGITRDRHYAEAEWDGTIFRLVDTGGLEFQTTDRLQKKMSDQAFRGIEEADCILCVVDGKVGVTTLDREWVEKIRKINKPKLFVVNKVDSAKDEALLADFYPLGMDPMFPVSAETSRGISDLLDRLIANLKETPPLCKGRPGGVEELAGISTSPNPSLQRRGENELTISIIGRPNVGKSTLLNRLLGEERAIVDETPGTTRDPINTHLTVDGTIICLIDTAGVRKKGKTDKAIEKFSIIKSLKSIEESDITLLVIDGAEGITDQDCHVAGQAFEKNKAIIMLVNKWDEGVKKTSRDQFLDHLKRKLHFTPDSPVLFISAKTGAKVEKIFPTILRIQKQYEYRVPTAELNREFARIIERHPLPVFKGRNIKIYYATQTGIKPPTFVVFSNEPGKIHFSYERYLNNALREAFGFTEVPVKILFRKRT